MRDMQEQWKSVAGYNGIYEVSDGGRVRSLPRPRVRIAKILTCNPPSNGSYIEVMLCKGSTRTQCIRTVHTLVLEAFVGPCPPGMECRHLDGNPANNRLVNLRYGTHAENMADKILHGTTSRGEQNGRAKLRSSDIERIRTLASVGITQKRIAEMFGISQVTTGQIVNRRLWCHVA